MTTFKLFLHVSFQLENIKAFYLPYKDTVISRTLIRISGLPTGQAHSCPLNKCKSDFISGILNSLWAVIGKEAVIRSLKKKKKKSLRSRLTKI